MRELCLPSRSFVAAISLALTDKQAAEVSEQTPAQLFSEFAKTKW